MLVVPSNLRRKHGCLLTIVVERGIVLHKYEFSAWQGHRRRQTA